MYTAYFGLTEAPFGISPNPRYLYMSEAHREALAHLLYGISSDGCIILLTGDVGTGKTTLCRCLMEQLPENTEVAVILNPRLTARELLKTICEEFHLLPDHSTGSIKTYIDALNAHLLRAHANDRNIAIIIDEAQNLAIDVLEQLRLLTNLETPTRKLLRILLLGQPELRDMVERPELSQVNQRITSRFHLGPLQPDDVRAYIQHRLNVAGDHSSSLFSEKAIRHVITLTGGIPRLINVLCDRALLGAYAINTDHVDLEIMKQAGEELFPNTHKRERTRKKIILTAAMLIAVLAVPAVVFIPDWLQPPPPESAPATIAKTTVKPEIPASQENTGTTNGKQIPAAPGEKEQQPDSIAPQKTEESTKTATGKVPEKQISEASPEKQQESGITEPPTVTVQENHDTPPANGKIEGEKPLQDSPSSPPPPLRESSSDQHAAIADKSGRETTNMLQPNNEHRAAEQVVQESETATSTDEQSPPAQQKTTTIKVSDPLMIREKAGTNPQQAVQALLAR